METTSSKGAVFIYVSAEQRIASDHPLRQIQAMTDAALRELSREFDERYAPGGRPSIAPERLLRALLLQILYSRRSERLLMDVLLAAPRFRVPRPFLARRTHESRRTTQLAAADAACVAGSAPPLEKQLAERMQRKKHLIFPQAVKPLRSHCLG